MSKVIGLFSALLFLFSLAPAQAASQIPANSITTKIHEGVNTFVHKGVTYTIRVKNHAIVSITEKGGPHHFSNTHITFNQGMPPHNWIYVRDYCIVYVYWNDGVYYGWYRIC